MKAAAIWQGRVDGWVASGVSCKEYATRIGVNPHTLAGWRHKLRQRGPAARPPEPARAGGAPGFVDVTTELAAALAKEPAAIELEVGGTLVRLRGQVDAEALSRVLGVLEERR